jgi:hypothetical protein
MIESCALFFSVCGLTFISLYLNQSPRRLIVLAASCICFSLAALTKATTYPAFAFLAGLTVLATAHAEFRTRSPVGRLLECGYAVAVLFVSLAIGLIWVRYTDAVKLLNPFGWVLTSSNLVTWNYGTWDQRVSAEFWRGAILDRALPEVFGDNLLLPGFAILAALCLRGYRVFSILAFVAFFLPLLLFTPLHLNHSYYQYANGIFGLCAVGFGICAINKHGHPIAAATLLGIIVGGQLWSFQASFADVIETNRTLDPVYVIARAAKRLVAPDRALLVLGQDWSSAIPYYSERRSLAMPAWNGLAEKVLNDPSEFLGPWRLGAVIFCPASDYTYRY